MTKTNRDLIARCPLERKAIDERRNVELTLEGATRQVSELTIMLSGAEGRASALDTQLAR